MVSENKVTIFNLKKKKKKNPKKLYFHDQKGLKLCEQILEAVAILDKKAKIFIFVFLNFNFSFY